MNAFAHNYRILPEPLKTLLSELQKKFREFDDPDVVFKLCSHLIVVNGGADNSFWNDVSDADALKIINFAQGMGIDKVGSYDQALMA